MREREAVDLEPLAGSELGRSRWQEAALPSAARSLLPRRQRSRYVENHASWRTTPRVGEVLQLGRRGSLVVRSRRHRLPLRNRLPPHHGTAVAGAFSTGPTTLFSKKLHSNHIGFFATRFMLLL